jgi:uncharacterized repeat protein (TIGR03837 family)
MQWDVFCRVIDNHGDIGVCWRLAADLASRGDAVRLWVDDASALVWMAPGGATRVQVQPWPDEGVVLPAPGDVVVEAFGCELPARFAAAMAGAPRPPTWINLEYLSAEAYVERSHRLPSPQFSGPARGLTKWFYYPGFTAATGGLIREPGLEAARTAFDREAWLKANGVDIHVGERLVSVFCYANTALADLPSRLADQPTLLLLTPGADLAGRLPPGVRTRRLPYLTQRGYDRLLWACDLNFVRGEDSFVRAQWAGRPFVWQIYPQDDGAHLPKLNAFLERFLAGASPALAGAVHAWWAGWNGEMALPARLPPAQAWSERCLSWQRHLRQREDLVTGLRQFALESR